MINGLVTNLEAIIPIEITDGPGTLQLSAVIDTGYNGHLTLPPSIIQSLKLASAGKLRGMLADGTIISMNTYIAQIEWLSGPRKVVVTATDGGSTGRYGAIGRESDFHRCG
jgi:clan AA aspartic protease